MKEVVIIMHETLLKVTDFPLQNGIDRLTDFNKEIDVYFSTLMCSLYV